jgi:prevent-host-death family protein
VKIVNVYEAKTNLSRLLSEVRKGREIVLARNGQPEARLVPYVPSEEGGVEGDRGYGIDRGLYEVPDDFNAPFPSDVLATFES